METLGVANRFVAVGTLCPPPLPLALYRVSRTLDVLANFFQFHDTESKSPNITDFQKPQMGRGLIIIVL